MCELDEDYIKTNILSKCEEDWVKTMATRVLTRFTKICPSDLLFYPSPSMFKLDPDMIKTNVLSKFEGDWVKTVATNISKI